uniref:Reverse transcriptase domain-containing protein n=1 Tax=Fagus sylvatica TaxID=28930 RepID=A0A2N9G3M1_FAGSY
MLLSPSFSPTTLKPILAASNSDEETPATRRESEQENSPSTRQDNQETAKLKEDNKKSNRQNEVEQQNGITSLARLMAEALQADCSVGVHDAEEETNPTILATKQQLRNSPADPNEAGEFELPWAWEPTSEKLGMADRNEAQMQLFRSVLDDCTLLDLGFSGWPFTWSNRRDGSAETWVRLDRGVCSKAWLDLHPNARIKHVSMATSDHLALVLDTLGSNQGFTRRKTRFRFEQAWVKDPACEGVVTDAWTTGVEGTRMFCVCQKIKECRVHLLNWVRTRRQGRTKKSKTIQRRRTNEITMLRDNHGAQITGEAGLEQVVSQDMNDSLLFPITEEEVKIALFQMNPSKAPGPDGMSALFFQKYWHVIGTDITNAVLDCISSRKLLKSVNYTHIALIPKAETALHYMKNKRRGGVTHLAAKLDMSKAYDRVEWSYLKAVMLKMGFDCRWVDLMMECISTVSYSILLNGTPTGHIIPSRGLRQGDPLSPYLFLICAEGFTSLIRKAENQKLIQGISISRGGPRFSHLFFADDSIIFCRAKIEECRALREILKLYEDASGQKLNMEKTSLFFSANTPEAVKEEIQTEMGVLSMNQMEKYLGLPPIIAGKEVLIKAVAQAIPTYAMSVFQLPVACSNEINSMLSNYWWGQKQGERRIHWMGWKKLARSKKQKCPPRHHMRGKVCWAPEKSLSWAPDGGLDQVLISGYGKIGGSRRVQLLRQWNVPLIDEIFEASEAAIIKSIPLSNRISSDVLIWFETRNGMYSVKSAYHLLMEAKQRNEASESSNTSRERDLWKGIWEASVPQKIKLFIWKACKGILPTKLNLFRKKVSNSFTCEFCDEEPESVEHVLVECQFAQEVWGLSPIVNVQQWPSFQNFADVVTHGLQVLNFPDVEIMFTIAWRLWLARNDRIWENHNTLARDICSQAGFLVTEFLDHQQNDSGMLPNAPSKWQPPNAPVYNVDIWVTYKINVAVSWRKQSRSGSVGTVVRDSLGQVIAAMCDVSSSFAEVSQFNAFAIQKSLLLAKNLGLHNVMVEGECRELLGFLRSPEPCLAPYGSLVDDIRQRAGAPNIGRYTYGDPKTQDTATTGVTKKKINHNHHFNQILLQKPLLLSHSLPPPKSSSLFQSLPLPKPKPNTSTFSSLPPPKSLNPKPNQPSSSDPIPKRVVQFRPPLAPPSIKSTHLDDDDDDEEEQEKERNRRRESESLAQAPSVKSFLSSIPAPKNSTTLGVQSSSGSGRRAIVDTEAPATASPVSAVDDESGNDANYVNYESQNVGDYYVNYDGYANYQMGSDQNANFDGQSQYGTSGGGDSSNYDDNYKADYLSGIAQSEISVLGKRGRKEIPADIVEVKQDELMKNRPREDQVKSTGIAFGPSYQINKGGNYLKFLRQFLEASRHTDDVSAAVEHANFQWGEVATDHVDILPVSTKGKPSKLHKRKHQIGSLYFDMRQKETELAERRSKGFLTKAETQAKYGW